MNICIIKTYKPPIHGVFLSERGEGIYPFIWAKFLADLGHKVYISAPSCPPPEYEYENVYFKTSEEICVMQFDVVIGFSCDLGYISNIQAKKRIFASFKAPNLSLVEKCSSDIIFASPYRTSILDDVKKRGYKVGLLPAIFSSHFRPPKFENKAIYCAFKFPCHRTFGTLINNVTKLHYDILNEVAKSGFKVYLFATNFYPINFEEYSELVQNENVYVYDYLPFNVFKPLIENCSVCVPCNSTAGVHIGLLRGIVPLSWDATGEGFLDLKFKEELGLPDYKSLTKNIIYERLMKLLCDKSYFEHELDTFRENAAIYKKEGAADCFNKLIGD
jgi:hypothetical protein